MYMSAKYKTSKNIEKNKILKGYLMFMDWKSQYI